MLQQERMNSLGRRTFLAGTAAATLTVVKPSLVRGTQANSTIELGMIGCGGRGNWIVPYFEKHGNYRFVACADYYQDQADKLGERAKVKPNRRYTTLSGYKKLLESKLDAVVIESPPYFHPEQAAAAVEAGKHVYLAKPVAVDVPGCQSIAESGTKASGKKLVVLVDFQTRNNPFYREAAKRVHEGGIGRLVCGEARYPCGVMPITAPKTPEDRLRYWYCNKAISGDYIVEQSIHALDVATWFIDAAPIKVVGTGGSKGLRPYGDIWDHFNLIYWFPNETILSFYSCQMVHGAPHEIACRIYGSQGTVDSNYYSHVCITGPKPWEGGKFNDMFNSGTQNNINDFYRFVTEGQYANETVAASVRSNLTAILGRTAAYQGRTVTWDEMMKAGEKLEADLKGLIR